MMEDRGRVTGDRMIALRSSVLIVGNGILKIFQDLL
jgi:hypothetical protein